MARIAYFDCPSGAAGDMIMGALVDAGAPFEALRDGLHGLDLTGWDLVRHEVRRGGFPAPQGDVETGAAAPQEHPPPGATRALPGRGPAELLRGFPVVAPGVRVERVTPTGAAILTTLANPALRPPAMTLSGVGYGAGTRDLPGTPNVLRCFVGETVESGGATETIVQVETTIDDMSPQLYEPLVDRLFEVGALDVFLTPVVMKRSRPGTVLNALCAPERVGELSRVLFEESSTIGVRWSEWRRAALPREIVTLATSYGPIPFKVSRLEGRVVTVTPEFADVARIAKEKALPVREVLDQARAEGRRLLSA